MMVHTKSTEQEKVKMKRKCLIQKIFMTPEQLAQYYMERRNEFAASGRPVRGVGFRRAIHPLLLKILAAARKSRNQTYEVIRDRRTASDRPHIFACTHVGYDDVATLCEAIRDSAYIFLGDPKTLYKDPVGLILYLNGSVFVELQNKNDRHVSAELSKRILKAGGNLLIFPEGVWNITESIPVLKLYWGAEKFAMETGADIIPVAIEQIGAHFVVNIGRNMEPEAFRGQPVGKMTECLRNEMSTLKWEIFEGRGLFNRAAVQPDEWKSHLRDIWGTNTNKVVTVEEIERGKFVDRRVTEAEQVFAHLKSLEPTAENAFVFQKASVM